MSTVGCSFCRVRVPYAEVEAHVSACASRPPLIELKCDCGWMMLVPPGTEDYPCERRDVLGYWPNEFVPCDKRVGVSTHATVKYARENAAFKARVAKFVADIEAARSDEDVEATRRLGDVGRVVERFLAEAEGK